MYLYTYRLNARAPAKRITKFVKLKTIPNCLNHSQLYKPTYNNL